MSDLVKIVAIACLAIMAVVAAFAFPETEARITFGSIIGVIGAIVGVPMLVARIRRRKDG